MNPRENHLSHRIGWLRAAVLGANDGIISTASLIAGVASSGAAPETILITGVAGMVSGAMAMATGEYVSVSSQADLEAADLQRERQEIKDDFAGERRELAEIYIQRGLAAELADKVALQLMEHDALGSHARDELGISEGYKARPLQAALASAGSFTAGAALPLLVALITPHSFLLGTIFVAPLFFLAVLGAIAGKAGGASMVTAALRVTFWGARAMILTSAVGSLFRTPL